MGVAYDCEDTHRNTTGESLVRETLAYRHMKSLEGMLNVHTTIGGHPLVTAQREKHEYVTRDQRIGERFKYVYWKEADIAEKLSKAATITTAFLDEEDQRMMLRAIRGRMDSHEGHVVVIQTKMLTHITETENHDMEIIAEIQSNTLETLRMMEVKEGNLSPSTKHNEAITILYKPGMEGNIYDTEGTLKRWAAYNKITGIKWKGTNKEKVNQEEGEGIQEREIARWILSGKERYPWSVREEDNLKELGTHELHWNLSGLLYESVINGWKQMGSDKERLGRLQETFAKTRPC